MYSRKNQQPGIFNDMKTYLIITFLFYSSFSFAGMNNQPDLLCSTQSVLTGLNSGMKKVGALRFDGNTVPVLTREKLIQRRLLSTLQKNTTNFCNENLSDERTKLSALLLNQANMASRYIGTVYFSRGSHQLSNEAIASCCSFIKIEPNYDGILIIGSTDSTGEALKNKDLSYMRGLAVAQNLGQSQPISLISLGSALLQGRNNVDDPHYRRADVYTYQIK